MCNAPLSLFAQVDTQPITKDSVEFENAGDFKKIEEIKQYIAYLEALLKKNAVDFSKEAIDNREKIEEELTRTLHLLNVRLKENDKILEEKREQNLMLILSVGGLIVFIIPLILSFVVAKNNRKSKQKNKDLNSKRDEIEEAYQKISASLNYTKKIQSAVFVRQEILKSHTDDSFILHQPKEIVSSNFYWFGQVGEELIIVAGDCSGIGVSGAFMTMMMVSFISEVVNNSSFSSMKDILTELNAKIHESYIQDDKVRLKDDVSLSIVSIDKNKGKVNFNGANSNVFINDGNVVKSIETSSSNLLESFAKNLEIKDDQSFNLAETKSIFMVGNGLLNKKGENSGICNLEDAIEIVESTSFDKTKDKFEECISQNLKEKELQDDYLILGLKL